VYGEKQILETYQTEESVIIRLKHPLGRLIIGPPEKTIAVLKREIELHKPPKIFTVGDMVSSNILNAGIHVDCVIIDFKTMRKSVDPIIVDNFNIYNVKNSPGLITREACNIIKMVCMESSPSAIIVEGEEDLLTLPVITFAPLDSFTIYGQPYVGIVLIRVTEKNKLEAKLLMNKINHN